MGAYIPEGYGELAFRWALEGDPQEMITTIGFEAISDPGPADLAELIAAAEDVEAEYVENVFIAAQYVKAGWSYRGAKYTVNLGGGLIQGLVGTPFAGTDVGETPPVNVSFLIQKFTGNPGRGGRGRMYVPPFALSESAISKQGIFTEASRAALTAQYEAWRTEVESNGAARLVLLHSMVGSNPAVPPTDPPFPITALYVDSLVATQRRRLRP